MQPLIALQCRFGFKDKLPGGASMSDPVEIVINNDGSVKISGDFVIKDPAGKEFGLAGRKVISLCRCGQSNNKPFCDGSHARTGFQDKVEARDLPPPKPKV
jgi:CDGSH-type Zn-finger protein